jgi:hypothetical protein
MELHQTRCAAAPFDAHMVAVGVTDESDFDQSVVLAAPALHASDALGEDIALDWAGTIRSHEKTILANSELPRQLSLKQASRSMS